MKTEDELEEIMRDQKQDQIRCEEGKRYQDRGSLPGSGRMPQTKKLQKQGQSTTIQVILDCSRVPDEGSVYYHTGNT